MGLLNWLKNLFGQPTSPPTSRSPADLARDFGDAVDPQLLRRDAPLTPAAPPTPTPAPSAAPRPAPSPPPPAPPESIDYDLGPFAPISAGDLRKGADRLKNTWNDLWLFGRSNRIPPADDPRTKLTDRAMVAHGLLTPEDLAEIHTAGLVYDAVRPDVQVELAKARLAITLPEQERAERKARKQAEAAERRRQHAAAVAHRQQTDIIFLGRGVSNQLHLRDSDEAKLQSLGLPLLSTPADVATALGLPIFRLRWLCYHTDAATVSHYVRFTVPKRSGGTRQLAAPHETLAEAQKWVLQNVLKRVPAHAAAHGFVPGRSTVSNALPHVGQPIVVNCDLRDFFPTITFGRVRGIFKQLGYSPAVATVFALLCTESPRHEVLYAGRKFHVAAGQRALPQGACTSPALSNLAARRLDSRLAGISRTLGFTYTRYADDLTFSGDRALNDKIGYLLARVRHVALDEGFAVNEKKTRVQRPHVAQTVTGIVVNQRAGVSRDIVRRLRAILHRARTEGLAAQNRENLPHFEAWLRGMISYVHMVNPQQALPLKNAFDALVPPAGSGEEG